MLKQRRCKVLELLACDPTILMTAHCRAVGGFRCRLLAIYLTLEAVAAFRLVISSWQI